MDIAGKLYPDTDTWSAFVTMYDETGGVLGTWEIGGKMELRDTVEGTYVVFYNEDGTEPVAMWYNIPVPVDAVLDIDWDKLIETYKIPIENWIKALNLDGDAGVALA